MCFHAACHSAQRFFRHRAGHVAGRRARRAHAPTDRHHPQTLACRTRQAAHAVASGGAGTCRLPADSDQHRLAGGSDLRNVWSCFRAPALVKHTQVTIKRGAIRYCNGLALFRRRAGFWRCAGDRRRHCSGIAPVGSGFLGARWRCVCARLCFQRPSRSRLCGGQSSGPSVAGSQPGA